MSQTAHHLKNGEFIFLDGQIYKIISKKEVTATGGHSVHFAIENVATFHRNDIHFALNHHVRTVDAEHVSYTLTHLIEPEHDRVFLGLLDTKTGKTREDLSITHPVIIDYLIKFFDAEENENNSLTTHFLKFHIDKLHRVDEEIDLECVSGVQGFDMTQLHDAHHGKHHGNKHH